MKTHTGKLTRRGWCRSVLQGCERGSGFYDSDGMGGMGVDVDRERKTPEQRKTRTKEV